MCTGISEVGIQFHIGDNIQIIKSSTSTNIVLPKLFSYIYIYIMQKEIFRTVQ